MRYRQSGSSIQSVGNLKFADIIFNPRLLAVIVMPSPSSSAKFESKGIVKLFSCTSDTSPGTMTTLGGVLVTLSVKVCVILYGKSSETVIVIT